MILSLLLFYAQYTGEPYYRLIERNWGQTVTVEYQAHPEHNSYQLGDLSLDGVVNQADSEIYNQIMPPFGWSLGGKVHYYRDCSYIVGKQVKAVEINNNLCIRCKARMIND
jgi:hypothetical protein